MEKKQNSIATVEDNNIKPHLHKTQCYGQFIRVDDVSRPLIKGEKFLVPCIVRTDEHLIDWEIVNGEPIPNSELKYFVTPVINHPHNDKENGQTETHYHVDYRFLKHDGNGNFPTVRNKHSKYYFCEHIRPQENLHGDLQYFIMPVINESFAGITPVNLISKSKLKHKCIHKGKCPHRGYDLSQVKAIDGKITCPLHGLQFNAVSGVVLNCP
jgi:hypothetical protein